jgi:hypothetical protein
LPLFAAEEGILRTMREHWTSLQQLERDLLAAGCRADSFVFGRPRGRLVDDAYRLEDRDGSWTITYTERGQDDPPIFTSPDRDAACRRFYGLLTSLTHWHLVGRFHQEADADALGHRLRALGLRPVRNDLPESVLPDGPRLRVFVLGAEVLAAREALGELPLTDDGA